MNKIRTLLALPQSLLFCLWHLPFKQAIKIPIIIYKPKYFSVTGKVIIDSNNISFGMIRLGLFMTSLYPNSGIRWDNKGKIIFKGRCCIGANSAISILHSSSYLEFGDNFSCSSSVRINCDYKIIFEERIRIGFDTTIMDSSLHRLKDMDGNFISRGYDEVFIGANTWIASSCLVMSGTRMPQYSIVAARSLLNKDYSQSPTHSLFAGSPAKFIKHGMWRDMDDNKVVIENE